VSQSQPTGTPPQSPPSPSSREGARSSITRRGALTGGAAGLAAFVAACGGNGGPDTTQAATKPLAIYAKAGRPRFVFVNHVTTNPFFAWARRGADDACAMVGATYQWTGSETSNVREMLAAFDAAVTSRADGIAVALTDQKAFNAPIAKALAAGIPVVSYNADAPDSGRLAYIGQDLFGSGQEMARRVIDLVGSGKVALFVATPGSSDLQPRVDGVRDILDRHPAIDLDVIASGAALPHQLSTIDAYVAGHPDVKGLFSVDGGSTQGVAQVMQRRGLRARGIKGGGYDLNPGTRRLLAAGEIDFAIDQQPYLQGFQPIMQLFQYRVSGHVTGLGDVNTGLKFVDREGVAPYNDASNSHFG
jgi:simple sugar transport system substrate-binding protein